MKHFRLSRGVRELITLAWPLVVARSSQTVIGFSDAAMCGRVSDVALAAATAGGLNVYNILVLPSALVYIIASFSAQFRGKGNQQGARRFGWYGLAFSVLVEAACVGIVMLLPLLTKHFSYSEEVREQLEIYMRIRLLSGGAMVATESLGAFYSGMGNTFLPMAANVIAMVVNVILNWLLIFGHGGFPAMGVAGSAWASLIASVAGFSVLLFKFLREEDRDALVNLKLAEFWRMLQFGFPHGLNWFFDVASFSFFIDFVGASLGTSTVAAMMIVMQLKAISLMPTFAVASAAAVQVGQAIGANLRNVVEDVVGRALVVAAVWQGFVAVIYFGFPTLLIKAFVSTESASNNLFTVGKGMLMLCAAWQLFEVVVSILTESLRAAGDTKFPMYTRTALAWMFFVPASWVTVHYWHGGGVSAMACFLAYMIFLAGVTAWRFYGGAWRSMELVDDAPAEISCV